MQQSWAATHNVNLLAANVNHPSAGASGSGIYSGRTGALDMYVSGSEKTKILKAQVPCSITAAAKLTENIPLSLAQSKLKIRHEDLSKYAIKFLNFAVESLQKGRLCHGNFCCNYTVMGAITSKNESVRQTSAFTASPQMLLAQ